LALPLDRKGRPLFKFEPSGMPDEVLVQTARNILLSQANKPSEPLQKLCIYTLMLQLQAASEYDAQQEWPAEVFLVADEPTAFCKLPQRRFRSPLNRRYVEYYHCDGPFEMSRSVWLANAIGRMMPLLTKDRGKSGANGADGADGTDEVGANAFSILRCTETDSLADLGVTLDLAGVHPTKPCTLVFGRNGFAIKSAVRVVACALLEEVMRSRHDFSHSRANGLVAALLSWLRSAWRCAAKSRNLGCAPRRSTMHFVSDQTATHCGVSRRVASMDTDVPLGIKFALVCGMIVHNVADWSVVAHALHDNRVRPPPDEAAKLGDRAGSFLWTSFLWLASADLEPLHLTEEERAAALNELLDIIIGKNARLDVDYRTVLHHEDLEAPYDPPGQTRPWFFCASNADSPCFCAPLVAVCRTMRYVDTAVILGEVAAASLVDDALQELLRGVQTRFTNSTDAEKATFRTSLTREAMLIVSLAANIPNAVEPSLQSRTLQNTLSDTAFASFLTYILACLDLNNRHATELAETIMLPPYSALPPSPPEPNAAVLACINKHIYKPGGVACHRLRVDFEARSAEQESHKRPAPTESADRLGTGAEVAGLGDASAAPLPKRAKSD
jgi:hypothetical protein